MKMKYTETKEMKRLVKDEETFKNMLDNGEFTYVQFSVKDSNYMLDNVEEMIKSKYPKYEASFENDSVAKIDYKSIIQINDTDYCVQGTVSFKDYPISPVSFNQVVSSDEVAKICNSSKDFENSFRGYDIDGDMKKVDLIISGDMGLMNGSYRAAAEVIRNSEFDPTLQDISYGGKNAVDRYFEDIKNYHDGYGITGYNHLMDLNTYENKTLSRVGNDDYVTQYKEFLMALDEKGYRPSNNFDFIDTPYKDQLLRMDHLSTINQLNSEGKTLLDVAYESKDLNLANDLVNKGARYSEELKEEDKVYAKGALGQDNPVYGYLDRLQREVDAVYKEEVVCDGQFYKSMHQEGYFEKLVSDGEFFKNGEHCIRSDYLIKIDEKGFGSDSQIFQALRQFSSPDYETVGATLRMDVNDNGTFDVMGKINYYGSATQDLVKIENVSVDEVKNILERNNSDLYSNAFKFDADSSKILSKEEELDKLREVENINSKDKEGLDLTD